MKCAVDIEMTVVFSKELIVDAATPEAARAIVLDVIRERSDDVSYTAFADDWDDWDEKEVDGEIRVLDDADRLIDRRTEDRGNFRLSTFRCDNCNAAPVRTVRYGRARVCSTCLATLPPLSG